MKECETMEMHLKLKGVNLRNMITEHVMHEVGFKFIYSETIRYLDYGFSIVKSDSRYLNIVRNPNKKYVLYRLHFCNCFVARVTACTGKDDKPYIIFETREGLKTFEEIVAMCEKWE